MQLEYLLFETTDDETGSCSFDAMASVVAARVPDLMHEVEAVLRWAHREFGAPSAAGDEGGWDFELRALGEDDAPLDIGYDFERMRVSMPQARGRVTLTLTVTGSPAFTAAFRDAFPESD